MAAVKESRTDQKIIQFLEGSFLGKFGRPILSASVILLFHEPNDLPIMRNTGFGLLAGLLACFAAAAAAGADEVD